MYFPIPEIVHSVILTPLQTFSLVYRVSFFLLFSYIALPKVVHRRDPSISMSQNPVYCMKPSFICVLMLFRKSSLPRWCVIYKVLFGSHPQYMLRCFRTFCSLHRLQVHTSEGLTTNCSKRSYMTEAQ